MTTAQRATGARLTAPHHAYPRIGRRHDPRLDAVVATLYPGDFYVATEGEWIMTVLGSCVSACVRDRALRIGGMNHFMLPEDHSAGDSSWRAAANAATRFGNVAMERLVNDILKLGGKRERLEFKLVGGARVLDAMTDVGERNVRFILDYMHAEGFRVAGADLGNIHPRKVLYDATTGEVRVRRLSRASGNGVADSEMRYRNRIDTEPMTGEIDFF